MLDQLLDMLRQNGQEDVVANPAVPNEHNEGVLQEAQSSIVSVLKGLTANGQADQAMALAADPAHPAVQQMQSGFIDQITQKFGISGDAAKGIAGSLIPTVLAKLQQGGSGGFNLGSITGMLGKTGLDKDGDGDVDLKDVTKMFGL